MRVDTPSTRPSDLRLVTDILRTDWMNYRQFQVSGLRKFGGEDVLNEDGSGCRCDAANTRDSITCIRSSLPQQQPSLMVMDSNLLHSRNLREIIILLYVKHPPRTPVRQQ
jgi:hypothetical protein